MAVCSTWSDERGAYTLPDPCRYEVAPGEWLVVRHAQPQKSHAKWWALMLGFLLF